jgi:hypothetical protein
VSPALSQLLSETKLPSSLDTTPLKQVRTLTGSQVRVPAGAGPEGWLDGVRKVYDDFLPVYKADPKHAVAILNMSWGWPRGEPRNRYCRRMDPGVSGASTKFSEDRCLGEY